MDTKIIKFACTSISCIDKNSSSYYLYVMV